MARESRTLTQQVPANAPAGTYTYALNVGTFPGTVLSTDAFTFVKQPGAAALPPGSGAGWAVSGWEEAASAGGPAPGEAPLSGVAGVGASPNPFVAATTIRFVLEAPAEVRLAVYDVLGREVAVLVDGALDAGPHASVFDGRGLPPGTYVYRLTAGRAVETGPMTLVR